MLQRPARNLQHPRGYTFTGGHMARNNKGVEGEGSYSGTRNYNERTKKFIDSGKVEEAARKAKPTSKKEADEMKQAEKEGKKHAKQ
jgi:hypothetical protein